MALLHGNQVLIHQARFCHRLDGPGLMPREMGLFSGLPLWILFLLAPSCVYGMLYFDTVCNMNFLSLIIDVLVEEKRSHQILTFLTIIS